MGARTTPRPWPGFQAALACSWLAVAAACGRAPQPSDDAPADSAAVAGFDATVPGDASAGGGDAAAHADTAPGADGAHEADVNGADGLEDAAAADTSSADTSPDDVAAEDASAEDAATGDAATGDAGAGPLTAVVSVGGDTVQIAAKILPDGRRSYTLHTTHPLRDGVPVDGTRTFTEAAGAARLRSPSLALDAFYALAQHERALASVASLHDGAWNGGAAIPCACFQTGESWTFAWTRDSGYAIELGLARHDATRARETLRFLLATPKAGGTKRILQDTGTGGSWPISTDRLVWALGARAVLWALGPTERKAWATELEPVLAATLQDDLEVAFDPAVGLLRGETSFLDWREQSYPAWVANRPSAIGRSFALSTNVAWLRGWRLLAEARALLGDVAGAATAQKQADAVAAAIAKAWLSAGALASAGVPHPVLPGDSASGGGRLLPGWWAVGTDAAPATRADALATALAAEAGLLSLEQARTMLARWSWSFAAGPEVITPGVAGLPIYHNRAAWPFVTGYVARAGALARAPSVVHRAADALLRVALLNLSNMENVAFPSGANWLDEGATSGPVVNSRRQLWSVGAALGLVDAVLVGVQDSDPGEVGADGAALRLRPTLPRAWLATWMPQGGSLQLLGLPWRGVTLDVTLHLPPFAAQPTVPPGAAQAGALAVSAVLVAGAPVPSTAHGAVVSEAALLAAAGATGIAALDVSFADAPVDADAPDVIAVDSAAAGPLGGTTLAPAAPTPAPMQGSAKQPGPEAGFGLTLPWLAAGVDAASISVQVRPPKVAPGAGPGAPDASTAWQDCAPPAGAGGSGGACVASSAADPATTTHCWTFARRFGADDPRLGPSSAPLCAFGPAETRRLVLPAHALAGGDEAFATAGEAHRVAWGPSGSSLQVDALLPRHSGPHRLALRYRNERPVQTGYGAGSAIVVVERVRDAAVLAKGAVAMGQTGANQGFVVSTPLLGLPLEHDEAIRVRVLRPALPSMSALDRAALYDGPGGKEVGAAWVASVDLAGVELVSETVLATAPLPALAFDGKDDFDKTPTKSRLTPGITLQPWERVSLSWDERWLHGVIVSQGFEDPARAYVLYLELVDAPAVGQAVPPPTQTGLGMTYLGLTPKLAFAPQIAIGVRRSCDLGDGYGPWCGVFAAPAPSAAPGAAWSQRLRLQPGVDVGGAGVFVAADAHTVAFRVPRAALGAKALAVQPGAPAAAPAVLRVTGHLVHGGAGQEWKDVVPAFAMPWTNAATGYLLVPLGGDGDAASWQAF